MSEWFVDFEPSARRDLSNGRITDRAVDVVLNLIDAIAHNPHRVGKPLREIDPRLAGVWSARRSEYRVLYRIFEQDRAVLIVHCGHRRDIYRPS